MNAFSYILEHIEGTVLFVSLLIAGVAVVLRFFDIQSKSSRRRILKEEFDAAIRQLSSESETNRLAAAILIRRFFTAERGCYRNETIYVLSSLLRVVPTGVFQKTPRPTSRKPTCKMPISDPRSRSRPTCARRTFSRPICRMP